MKNIKIQLSTTDFQRLHTFCKTKGVTPKLYVRYCLADFTRSSAEIIVEPYLKVKECDKELSVDVSDMLYERLKQYGNMIGKVARHILLTRFHVDEMRGDYIMVFNAEIAKMMEIDT